MNPKEILSKILLLSEQEKYPDIHLTTGKNPFVRNRNGEIICLKEWFEVLTYAEIAGIIEELIWKENFSLFQSKKDFDASYVRENLWRYRVNCYINTNWYSVAMRLIPDRIPSLESLGLWGQIKNMCEKSKGLILVTWPTGSGKSTNLAAMIEYINENYKKHIITIEDPVEFAFQCKKSLIHQREVGNHTGSFTTAIKSALREDPDIVMVGEMRDPETIKATITLAETGHLVFSTLHTNDSVQTVDRIVDVFPSNQQTQIRMQLSQCLIWILSQRLLPREDKEWRVAAREIFLANDATRNLIISWKTHQLYSVLEVWKNEGMILGDKYILALYKKNIISLETLKSFVRDKDSIEMMIS